MNPIDLHALGLNDTFEQEAGQYEGLHLARVSQQHRDLYMVFSAHGELRARVSGKLAYNAGINSDFPAVGDWVMIDRTEDKNGIAIMHRILKRNSVFARKAAGTSNQLQIIAANIDTVFICMSLNNDFNLRRLERYLSIAWDSGSTPVIVLTKSDLCDDLPQRFDEVYSVAVGTDVLVTSSINAHEYEDIYRYIEPGKTIAFIGSSGVGKSTLINRLLGQEVLATKGLRNDDKGRHATTYRQLILLPQGGIVIDTPGMRELQLSTADLAKSFEDIEGLAGQCKYRDCRHLDEPGCAAKKAVEDGSLSQERLDSYHKLMKELGYQGMDSRQLEQAKIRNMFGGKGAMKQAMDYVRKKHKKY